jgi:hypothetical protein
MQKQFTAQAIGLALAGMFVVGAANAADKGTAAPAQAAVSVNVQGVQVAIDPATGRLVEPTAVQRTALSEAMQQRAERNALAPRQAGAAPRNEAEARATLRTVRLNNGTTVVGMDLPEDLMSSLVAERNADGSLSIHHAGDGHPPQAVEVTQ